MLIRPSESKFYLLKHCNIVHDAVMAALPLSRLVAPQGHGYHHVPDHPELDRTALCSSLCRVWTLPHLTSTEDAASKLAPMALSPVRIAPSTQPSSPGEQPTALALVELT